MEKFLKLRGYPENYSIDQIEEINKVLSICKNKATLSCLLNNKYNTKQIKEIAIGIKDGIPVHHYAKINYDHLQMREIRIGLMQNIDIRKYCNNNYSYIEMKKIRQKQLLENYVKNKEKEKYYELFDCLHKGLNIDLLLGDYSIDQIREIKKSLESNIFMNLSNRYSAQQIKSIRESIQSNRNVSMII